MDSFVINELYSHEDIYRSLGVGNAGGVRFLLNEDGSTKRGVLFTALPEGKLVAENPYHDRIEDGVLVYTAQGRRGEQGFGGQNQRLLRHAEEMFPLYCFQLICSRRNKTIGVNRWRFLGLLFGLRKYKEQQIDVSGTIRTACVFEFGVLSDFGKIVIDSDAVLAKALYLDFSRCNYESHPEFAKNTDVFGSDPRNEYTPEELEQTRSQMLSLHPQRFEELIKTVLTFSGYVRVCTTKYSQDGGIDVEAYAGEEHWPIRNMHLQIQAKRWLHTVGRKEIAELRGSLAQYTQGAIVTTSQFSKSALLEANENGKLPIVTVDGYDFAGIVRKYNVTF